MQNHNFVAITIPKQKRLTFEALVKVFGISQTYDYSDTAVAATCRVYLSWGIN